MTVRACTGPLFSVLTVVLFAVLMRDGGGFRADDATKSRVTEGMECASRAALGRTSGTSATLEPAVRADALIRTAGSGAPVIEASARRAGVTDGWLGKVMTHIERQEYRASASERGLQAPNRAHNLRTYFLDGGIEVVPRTGEAGDGWSLRWRTIGWGREGHLVDVAGTPCEPQAHGSRVSYFRDGLEEWYENKKEGLEQGFVVRERHEGEGPLCIEGRVGNGLRAEYRPDEGSIDFMDGDGARVLRYAELHVRDAGGREVPSYLKLEGDKVAILVDDADAVYPLVVDPLVTSPSWTAESDQARTWFGCSVGTAGDVNGDGYSDVIVGAEGYDNGQNDEGCAFVYHGSAGGLGLSPAWTAECNQAKAYFGHSVGTAGDVNGDGYSDVIVGADGYTDGETQEGRAYVYHGSAGGLAAGAAWVVEGDQAEGYFGISVGTAGDVNGDGYSDVIVGADGYTDGEAEEGRACVYHGSAGGLGLSPAWTAESDQAGAWFGCSVGTAGDVNGDGYSDVVGGAEGYTNGQTEEGRALVYHGSPDDPVGIEDGRSVPNVSSLLGRATPNPFGASIQLTYTLPDRGHVRLVVCNVAGQRVAVLKDGEQDAGCHIVDWDGNGTRGAQLPSGVYFVQLHFKDHKETRKIVLTR